MTLVAACCTLLTVPPFPEPSSRNTIRSSALRSSRNSTPISRVSCLSLFPMPPGICASPAEGAGLGAGALSARPLRFFRFIVFGFIRSPMVTVCAGCRQTSKAGRASGGAMSITSRDTGELACYGVKVSLPPEAASTVARQSRQAPLRDVGVYWIGLPLSGAQVLKLTAVERQGLIGAVDIWTG
jgi:hypothetical protein